MTPERWRQVDNLFQRAIEVEVTQRGAFLAQACGGDNSLRSEVESLLAADGQGGTFLETPVQEMAHPASPATTPESPSWRDKNPFFWFVVATGAFMIAGFVFNSVMIFRHGRLAKDPGWQSAWRAGRQAISRVNRDGPAAGKLLPGDKPISWRAAISSGQMQDGTYVSRLGSAMVTQGIGPNGAYILVVDRGARKLTIPLTMGVKKPDGIAFPIAVMCVAVFFGVVGLIIGLLQPSQESARLFYLMALLMSLTWATAAVTSISMFTPGEAAVWCLYATANPFHDVFGYWFCYRFPPGVPRGRIWSAIGCGIAAIYGLQWVQRSIMHLSWLQIGWAESAYFHAYAQVQIWQEALAVFDVVYFACCAGVLIRNYRISRKSSRSRLKWVIGGFVAGFLPIPFAYGLIPWTAVLLGFRNFPQSAAALALRHSCLILIALMPIAAAYGILKHQVFDIHVFVRRGLRYLLAKNGLRFLLALPAAGLIVSLVSQPDRTLRDIVFRNSVYFYVLLAATIGISIPFRKRLSRWIDRRFFRDSYNREKMLLLLADEITTFESLSTMSRRVGTEVAAALHPQSLHIFQRTHQHGDLLAAFSSGESPPPAPVPSNFHLVSVLEDHGKSLEFPLDPKYPIPWEERLMMSGMGARLLIPAIGATKRLAGLIVLDEKKSEEPYTPEDRELLEAVAKQMALVLENAWLKANVSEGKRIQREVLSHFGPERINLVKECPRCGACYDRSVDVCASDAEPLTFSVPVERVVAGKYRLERLLGRGGMGAVYAATDLKMGRQVAVKILLGSMFGDTSALDRFAREAQALARLSHPRIVTVYDFGEVQGGSSAGAYLVMELVAGSTLRAEFQQSGKQNAAQVAAWLPQVLDGIEAAHLSGVLHRDLKPENILISRTADGRPSVKVLDFGLAKMRSVDSVENTRTFTVPGILLGTLGYMSPEQLQGETADESTDVFGLGVIAIEALTGDRPYSGKTPLELLRAMNEPPGIVLAGDSAAASRLQEVLQRCVSKERGARYDSIAGLRADLVPALAGVVRTSAGLAR